MTIKLKAGLDDDDRRIDRILRKALPDYPLSLIHRLLRQGKVLVNEKKVRADSKIQNGDAIEIFSSVNQKSVSVNNKIIPPAPLPGILWQGCGIVVFNKPTGMATHGPGSLADIVAEHYAGTLPRSLSFKPGPLHRLDKPTSGAIAFSTTLEGARLFTGLLRQRRLIKTYLAIVEGKITAEDSWEDNLVRDKAGKKTHAADGKNARIAITRIKPVSSNGKYSLIEARIVTGRTHQIRAQAAAHGHPLEGDKKYGSSGSGGFFLHAWKIELDGESGGVPNDFPRLITAPPPELFQSRINSFFDKMT